MIDALDSFRELANGRTPMPVADLALAAVYSRLIEYSDADLGLAECMVETRVQSILGPPPYPSGTIRDNSPSMRRGVKPRNSPAAQTICRSRAR